MSVHAIMLHSPLRDGVDDEAALHEAQARFLRLLRHTTHLATAAFAGDIEAFLEHLEAAVRASPSAAASPAGPAAAPRRNTVLVHYTGHVSSAASIAVHAAYRGQTMSLDLVSETCNAAAGNGAAIPNVVLIVDSAALPPIEGGVALPRAAVAGALQACGNPLVGSVVALFPTGEAQGASFAAQLAEHVAVAAAGTCDLNAALMGLGHCETLADAMGQPGGGVVAGAAIGSERPTLFRERPVVPPPVSSAPPPLFVRAMASAPVTPMAAAHAAIVPMPAHVAPAPAHMAPAPIAFAPAPVALPRTVGHAAAVVEPPVRPPKMGQQLPERKRQRDVQHVPPPPPPPSAGAAAQAALAHAAAQPGYIVNGMCLCCNVPVADSSRVEHLSGKKHQKKAGADPMANGNFWRCDACRVVISGRANADQHAASDKHARQVMKQPGVRGIPYLMDAPVDPEAMLLPPAADGLGWSADSATVAEAVSLGLM